MKKNSKKTPEKIISLENFKHSKNQKQYPFLNTEMLTPSELKFLQRERLKCEIISTAYLKKRFNIKQSTTTAAHTNGSLSHSELCQNSTALPSCIGSKQSRQVSFPGAGLFYFIPGPNNPFLKKPHIHKHGHGSPQSVYHWINIFTWSR